MRFTNIHVNVHMFEKESEKIGCLLARQLVKLKKGCVCFKKSMFLWATKASSEARKNW